MDQNEQAYHISVRVGEKLAHLSPSSHECCIFRVYDQLRKVNEKAYQPDIIAIGPYHHGNDKLQMMEEHKLRYLKLLLTRKDENVQKYIVVLAALEEDARRCYSEPISLDSNEFIEMMLFDGCFIVELVRKFRRAYLRERNDPIFKMNWIISSLQRDLLLIENQLPFFVVCKLFEMIEIPDRKRFIYLSLWFFHDLFPGPVFRVAVDGDKIKHLLELVHENCLPSYASEEPVIVTNKKESLQFIHCATQLREAGVSFEKNQEDTISLFDIKFKNGVMKIPPLIIEDRTESFFRNLVAYEEYGEDNRFNFVTNYLNVMDCLIDSPKDVRMLCRQGIIDNWLGDDEVVSTMFNNINKSVTRPSNHFHYAGVFEKVNIHYSKSRNRYLAILRRIYLNNPWKIMSILAAAILLILTLLQTVFTIKS